MPSVYDLKPKFQSLLRPIVGSMANKGVTANQVTIAALFLSIITGVFLTIYIETSWIFIIVPTMLFVRMALNAIDGMLAREHNMSSKLGAILNELADVFSDSFIYLPFALLSFSNPLWAISFVILAVISEMIGVVAIQIGATRRYDGPMGKSDRAFILSILALIIFFGVERGVWIDYIFIGLDVLLLVTIYNRGNKALKECA